MNTEKRTSKSKEAAIQCFTGMIFGGTNTLVGHPFDTVKTKMQAQAGMMSDTGGNSGYLSTVKKVFAADGFTGFYRGWMPPFLGSVIFRSM